MKIKLLLLTVSIIIFITFSCQQPVEEVTEVKEVKEVTEVTEVINYQTGLIQMVTVSAITNFDMGYTGVATPVHTVPLISSFKMGRYEVTYKEWCTVRTWAISNGYTFANAGIEGHDGTIGAVATPAKNEPVTTINWRDCIVWCNAASQYDGLIPCYTYSGNIIKNSSDANATACDNAVCNWSANGYRLPTEAEWEACARYQNGTTWTPGTYASGATADYNDAGATGAVAWYSVNCGSASHDAGTKNANQLVIFDMSGNVWEWCWDWYGAYINGSPYTDSNPKGPTSGSSRVVRGGSWGGNWYDNSNYCQVSCRYYYDPNIEYYTIGFRLARTN